MTLMARHDVVQLPGDLRPLIGQRPPDLLGSLRRGGCRLLRGPPNLALPGWLDRILPRLAIEARDEAPATGPEAGMDPAKAR